MLQAFIDLSCLRIKVRHLIPHLRLSDATLVVNERNALDEATVASFRGFCRTITSIKVKAKMHKIRNIYVSTKSGRATPSLRGNSPAFHLGAGGRLPNSYFLGGVPGFAGPGLDGPGLAGGWLGFQGCPGFCAIAVHLLSRQNLYALPNYLGLGFGFFCIRCHLLSWRNLCTLIHCAYMYPPVLPPPEP